MKILYLTTHVEASDFQILASQASIAPNPAGQNFHGKLIDALAEFDEVNVVSLIPNSENILSEKTIPPYRNRGYRYIAPPSLRIAKRLFLHKRIAKEACKEDADVVLYDSLNLTLARASKIIAAKLNIPRIAICTDDPANISFAPQTYKEQVVSLSKKADGYFALTEGLVELFNENRRPSLVRPGIIKRTDVPPKNMEKPYIYYGGALFIKDGTKDLIDGYISAKPNLNLIIAGHGPFEGAVIAATKANKNILYLGQISEQENIAYQKGAALLVNPRLYNGKLDRVSVPSKVLEYLTNGKYIASTKSTSLFEDFEPDINWIGDEESFGHFLNRHLTPNGDLIDLKENKSQEILDSRYGLEAIGRSLHSFLESFKG